jgi:hypothetical protein
MVQLSIGKFVCSQESEVLSIIRYRGTSKIAGQLLKNTRSATHFWGVGLNIYLQVDQHGIKG